MRLTNFDEGELLMGINANNTLRLLQLNGPLKTIDSELSVRRSIMSTDPFYHNVSLAHCYQYITDVKIFNSIFGNGKSTLIQGSLNSN